jgi:diacylglycerol kinase (ATP)
VRRLIVIYNPTSGNQNKIDVHKLFTSYFEKHYTSYEIWESKSAKHMQELCELLKTVEANYVVAAGGDGTVNAVAKAIANTNKQFYILPLGSGNGLARHFKYPLDAIENIQKLNKAMLVGDIDTAYANENFFVNVSGVGFDAHISHVFANNTKRGLWGYIKAILKELPYKCQTYQVQTEQEQWEGKAFLISVCNASQWGNNMHINPFANPKDKLINVTILKPFSLFQIPHIIWSLWKNKPMHKQCLYLQSPQVHIKSLPSTLNLHCDGEPINNKNNNKITFKVKGNLCMLFPYKS